MDKDKGSAMKQMKIPLPKPEQRIEVEDPSTSTASSAAASTAVPLPSNTDSLQGVYVHQLPFPGVLNEKTQREQLSAIVRKYSKIVDVRFDAVPNNPDLMSSNQGRRCQLPPLSRRALIIFQKIASCVGLLAELNRQTMGGCQLKASLAPTESINAVMALKAAAKAAAANTTSSTKVAAASTSSGQSGTADVQKVTGAKTAKRSANLLRTPSTVALAAIMDAQIHLQPPDPFHKNSSRTLYIRHLDTNIAEEELKTRYGKFGHILDIEVKNRNTLAPYAFLQFTNIESVANAIRKSNQHFEAEGRNKKNSTHHWWGNTIVSSRLWIGRLPPNCGDQYLMSKMRVVLTQPEHDASSVVYDPEFNEAIVIFSSHEAAQIAFTKIKNRNITFQPERSSIGEQPVCHVHVDFCSEKLHDYFVDRFYRKNTESVVSVPDASSMLAPPPDPPKCLPVSASMKKSSPSPPPDPSTEVANEQCELARNRVGSSAETVPLRPCSSADKHNHEVGEEKGTTRHPQMGKTTREHSARNEESGKRTKEKGKSAREDRREERSSSASSNSSTVTYSLSPRKKWRRQPEQHSSSRTEHGGDSNSAGTAGQRHRHKVRKQQTANESGTKYSWDERKHRSHRSLERRRERRAERDREGRRRTRTGMTSSRRGNEASRGGTRNESRSTNAPRRHRPTERREKGATTAKKSATTEQTGSGAKGATSSSSAALLPPPPVPPKRLTKSTHHEARKRPCSPSSVNSHSSLSSYSSHSSCCSSSSENSSSDENENTDGTGKGSNAGKKATNKRNNKEDEQGEEEGEVEFETDPGRLDEQQIAVQLHSEIIHSERLKLASPSETKPLANTAKVTAPPQKPAREKELAQRLSELLAKGNEEKEKKLQQQQAQQKRDSFSGNTEKKNSNTNTAALCSKPSTSSVPVRQPSRQTASIPLEPTGSATAKDPRQRKEAKLVELELPRFALKWRNDRAQHQPHSAHPQLAKATHRDSIVSQHESDERMTLSTPMSAPPTANPLKGAQPYFTTTKFGEESAKEGKPATKLLAQMAQMSERIRRTFEDIERAKNANLASQYSVLPKTTKNIQHWEVHSARVQSDIANGIPLDQIHTVGTIIGGHRASFSSQLSTPLSGEAKTLPPKADQHTEDVVKAIVEEVKRESVEAEAHHERRPSIISEPDLSRARLHVKDEVPMKLESPTISSTFLMATPKQPLLKQPQMRPLFDKCESASPVASSLASPSPRTTTMDQLIKKPRERQQTPTITQQQQRANSVSIPKLREIKLDRKFSTQSSEQKTATSTDPRIKSMIPPTSTMKKEENKEKHLMEKKEEKATMRMVTTPSTSSAVLHQKNRSMTMVAGEMERTKEARRKREKERERDERHGHGRRATIGSKVHREEESASEAERQRKKQKKKRRRNDDESSSESEESGEADEGDIDFDGVDVEQQRRMLAAIKSGFGPSMYDRVKRRSTQRPAVEEQKKKSALELLKEKQAKKKKEFSRIKLSSTSSESEASSTMMNEDERRVRKEKAMARCELEKLDKLVEKKAEMAKNMSSASEADEDVEVDVDDTLEKTKQQREKEEQQRRATVLNSITPAETAVTIPKMIKANTPPVVTIRRPEYAPRKPAMMEEMIKREEENTSEGGKASEESANEEPHDSDAMGDAAVREVEKLKAELGRYRHSSESSSIGSGKDFEQKLAKVMEIASQGIKQQYPSRAPISSSSSEEEGELSSTSSSSSSSAEEQQPIVTQKGVAIVRKQEPKKKLTHVSIEDVFGTDSSDEDGLTAEQATKKMMGSQQAAKTKMAEEKKNQTIPKIKLPKKRGPQSKLLKAIARSAAVTSGVSLSKLLVVNEKEKRSRVPSLSSVSSIEQKEKAKKKSTSVEKQSPAATKKLLRQSPILSESSSSDDEEKSPQTSAKALKAEEQNTMKKMNLVTENKKATPMKRHLMEKNDESKEQRVKKAKLDKENKQKVIGAKKLQEQTAQSVKQTKSIEVHAKANAHLQSAQHAVEAKEQLLAQNRNNPMSMMDIDPIGLLGFVTAPADGEFEVIDSGKVPTEEERTAKILEVKKSKDEEEEDEEEGDDEDDAMEAELLRRMEEKNEEEEAVAALQLQSKVARRDSQDSEKEQHRLNLGSGGETKWGEVESAPEEREDEEEGQANVVAHHKAMDNLRPEEVPTTETEKLSTTFRLETIERRASNESVESHLTGAGFNGFVEVDAEHLRQQKREQDELVRLAAEEQKKAEEAQRMDQTVDFVAAANQERTTEAATTSTRSKPKPATILSPTHAQIHSTSAIIAATHQISNESGQAPLQEKLTGIVDTRPSHYQLPHTVQLQQSAVPQQTVPPVQPEKQIPTIQLEQLPIVTSGMQPQMQQQNTSVHPPQRFDIPHVSTKYTAMAGEQPIYAPATGASSSSVPVVFAQQSQPQHVQNVIVTQQQQPQSRIFVQQGGTGVSVVHENLAAQQQRKSSAAMHVPQQSQIHAVQQQQIVQKTQTVQQQQGGQHPTQAVQQAQAVQQHQRVQAQWAAQTQQQAPLQKQVKQHLVAQQNQNYQVLHQQMQQQMVATPSTSVHQQEQLRQQQQQVQAARQQQKAQQHLQTASSSQQLQFNTNQQYQQYQQHIQQQYRQQQSAAEQQLSSAMAAAGLMDPSLLYRLLREQPQMMQTQQFQMAMMANQITPAALAKLHQSLSAPTSTVAASQAPAVSAADSSMNAAALEGLLRGGLLGPSASALMAQHQQSGAFEELIRQHQQQQQLAQQMNAAVTSASLEQQRQQQHALVGKATTSAAQQPQQMLTQPQMPVQQQPPRQPPQQMPSAQSEQQRPTAAAAAAPKKQSSANKNYPVLWQGQLAMKNADTLVQMHKVCGNEQLIARMNAELVTTNENGIPLIRVNQRMRLEQTQLDSLMRKMEREENHIALICLPCGRDREDVQIQTAKMYNSFIEYFSAKSAAGIVSSGAVPQSNCVAHIFPPSDFSRMLLARNAPDLLQTVEQLKAGYLFVILANK